jgi:hypothetical protein
MSLTTASRFQGVDSCLQALQCWYKSGSIKLFEHVPICSSFIYSHISARYHLPPDYYYSSRYLQSPISPTTISKRLRSCALAGEAMR